MRIGTALLFAAACLGMTGIGRAESGARAARAPEAIYRTTCGYCHGHNVGPIILGRQIPASTVQAMVRSGRGAMPAFRPTEITTAELAALGRWIERSERNPKEHGK